MQKKPIIIIAVLSVLALGLGYWYGLPKEGSGGDEGNNGGGKPWRRLNEDPTPYLSPSQWLSPAA